MDLRDQIEAVLRAQEAAQQQVLAEFQIFMFTLIITSIIAFAGALIIVVFARRSKVFDAGRSMNVTELQRAVLAMPNHAYSHKVRETAMYRGDSLRIRCSIVDIRIKPEANILTCTCTFNAFVSFVYVFLLFALFLFINLNIIGALIIGILSFVIDGILLDPGRYICDYIAEQL